MQIRLLIGLLVLPLSLFAQKTMEVFGVGELTLSSDYTIVHITVGSKEMPYDKLVSTVDDNTKTIENLIRSIGIKDSQIEITGLFLNDVYGSYPILLEGPRYDGWRVITVKYEQKEGFTEQLLDKLSNSKVKPYFRVSFGLTDKSKVTARNKLIELALRDAKRNAEIIASTYDLKVVGIKSIQYGNVSFNEEEHSVDLLTDIVMPSYKKYPMESPKVEYRESVLVIWEFEEK